MRRRSGLMRWTAGAAALALLVPAQPAFAAPDGSAQDAPDVADFVVYAFSQTDAAGEDPQVYELDPDINIRATQKWSTIGDEATDYNFAAIDRYHDQGITFIGGGTASIIFPNDFPSPEIFDDMSTRDAENAPVPHDEFGFEEPARRGNIFNPKYRAYLLDWVKIQIDGGVDGVNLDEINAGFGGGQKYNFNGNEGFDDYTIADFTRYLLDKYPDFTAEDWTTRFGMTADNLPRADVPADDLDDNFNYRDYLAAGGWSTDPMNAANPLAAEWGTVVPNRMYADDTSFTATYLRRYWKELVDELRGYASRAHGRHLLISSNGLWPYVDYNSIGMYPWNRDEQTPDFKGAAYLPVVDGHLDGGRSLAANYRYLKEKNAEIAGDVPAVVFIDWPNEMMDNYLALLTRERKDYWRIFGAEAYANGLFPAFHLRDTVGSPTAEDLDMMSFFKKYTRFYQDNRSLFLSNDHGPQLVRVVGADNVAASLLVQRGTGARTIHLVNHNYEQGIVPQTGLSVLIDLPACPRQVTMVSPDFTGSKTATSRCQDGKLQVIVDQLDYYNVLVLR